MDNNMFERAKDALLNKKRRSIWHRVVSVLGCVVVFCTTYALILPAITMTRETICGLEEHAHTQECYETRTVEGEVVLSCDLQKLGIHVHEAECYDENHVAICGYANYVVHVHDDNCYADGELVCQLQKIEEHAHDAACYESQQKLVCGLEEGGETHIHDDSCYTEEKTLVCTEEEGGEIHTHDAACYTEEKTQICTKEEGGEIHVHDDSCYTQQKDLTCGQEEVEGVHAHTDECYTVTSNLTCGKEEKTEIHTHNDDCYKITSKLTCTKEEVTEVHTHGDACYTVSKNLTCGKEEVTEVHTHSDSCYETADVLVCNKTEVKLHTHEGDCFQKNEDGTETLICTQLQVTEHVHADSCFIPKTETVTVCGLEPHAHVDACYPTEPEETEEETTEATEEETTEATEEETTEATESGDDVSFFIAAPETGSDATEATEASDGIGGSYGALNWRITAENEIATLTISGSGEMTSTSYSKYPWYSYASSINRVVIEEGVTSVSSNAFEYYYTNLTSVSLPASLTSIGGYAFNSCTGLSEITLPDSLTSIGSGAFYDCSGLTEVGLPNGYSTWGDRVFTDCVNMVGLNMLPAGTYYIHNNVMYRIVDGKAYVSYCAADVTEFLSSIPDEDGNANAYQVASDKLIDCGTWEGKDWRVIEKNGKWIFEVLGEGYLAGVIADYSMGPGFTEYISPNFAKYGSAVDELVIPEGITGLGQSVFSGFSKITSVNIPKSVSLMESYAFGGCSALEHVTINGDLSQVSNAFGWEASFSVTFAEGVTKIPGSMFNGCSLEKVDLPDTLTTIGWNAFSNTGIKSITIPKGVVDMQSAFNDCSTLETVIFAEGTELICDGAFSYCTNLSTVQIPNSVTHIGSSAFSGCTGLTSVTLPDSVISIGERAFASSGVTDIVFSKNLEKIGYGAFEGCTGLTELELPGRIKLVDGWAFGNCTGLTSVKIPAGYASWGDGVFYNCTGLPGLDGIKSGFCYTDANGVMYLVAEGIAYVSFCPEGVTDIPTAIPDENGVPNQYPVQNGTIFMSGVSGEAGWIIIDADDGHRKMVVTGTGLFGVRFQGEPYPWEQYAQTIHELIISDGVTSLSDGVFYNFTEITTVSIPNTVTIIESSAFGNCTSLTSVHLPAGYITFGGYAPYGGYVFSGCTGLDNLQEVAQGNHYIHTDGVVYAVVGGYAYVYHCPDSVTNVLTAIPDEAGNPAVYPVESGNAVVCGVSGDASWIIVDGEDGVRRMIVRGTGRFGVRFQGDDYPWLYYRDSVDEVVLSDGITCLGDGAFSNFEKITSVIIPDSVTNIEDGVFQGCTGLTQITLPKGYSTWGKDVFTNTGLGKMADLSAGTYYIHTDGIVYSVVDGYAYVVYCPAGVTNSLTAIPDENGTPDVYPVSARVVVANGTIENVNWIIYDEDNVRTMFVGGEGHFGTYINPLPWSTYAETVDKLEIAEGITGLGDAVFSGFKKITEVDIPDTVTAIGYQTFYDCSGLNTITIPGSVSTVDSYAFSGCSGLRNVTIMEGVESVGTFAFADCDALTEIVIPASVTWLGGSVLSGIDDVKVVILGTETYYSSGTFSGCTNYSLVLPDSMTEITSSEFYNYSGMKSIVLPADLKTINYRAFGNCTSLESITVRSDITSMGQKVFEGCSIQKITFAEGVTAVPKGFCSGWTSLTTVELPSSLRTIEYNAFYKCTALTDIEIPEGVTDIKYYAFEKCSALTNMELPSSLTNLEWYAFTGCESLTDITIPNGITTIDNGVFYNCSSLTCVTIPETVTQIGNNAFYGCAKLATIELPKDLTSIGNSAFKYCNSLKGLEIPKGVTTLGSYAFENCTALTEIVIPGSVKTLEGRTFNGCTALERVILEDGVESVAAYGCYGLTALAEVVLPDSLTNIGNYAFQNCTKLAKVTLPAGFVTIGNSVFTGCTQLDSDIQNLINGYYYTDDQGVVYYLVGEYAFVQRRPEGTNLRLYILDPNTGIKYTVIDGKVLATGSAGTSAKWIVYQSDTECVLCFLGSGSMKNYSGASSLPWKSYASRINRVEIEDGITSIGQYAFDSSSKLTSITIPESVVTVGAYAFRNCSNLKDLNLPGNIKRIENDTFYGCSNLTSVTMPDNLEFIGNYAFYGCRNLTGIEIPEGVTSIGTYAFYNCSSITGVVIPDGVKTIQSYTFQNCSKLSSVVIPEGVISIGSSAFENCSSLTSVTIPVETTTLQGYTFEGCSALETVYLNASGLSSCGYGVFSGCGALKEVVVGTGVDTLYYTIFYYMKSGAGKAVNVSFDGPNYFALDRYFSASYVDAYLSEYKQFLVTGKTYYVDENDAIYLVEPGMAYYLYCPMSSYIAPKTIPTEAFDGTTYPVYSSAKPDVVNVTSGISWFIYGKRLMVIGACNIPSYKETSAPWYAYREEIEELDIQDSITGIGTYAFNGFTKITTARIPQAATSVSASAFQNCTQLQTFSVADGNTAFSTEKGILYNADQTKLILCPGGKRVVRSIPDTVVTIGESAFAYNCNLTAVEIPNSVSVIEKMAFYNCDSLTSMVISGTDITVGEMAFYDCDGLALLTISGTNVGVGASAFYDCGGLSEVKITAEQIEIGKEAFRNCDSVAMVSLVSNAGITLGENAFYDCDGSTVVEITADQLEIGKDAFMSCDAATNVSINSKDVSIGAQAFRNCISLQTLNIQSETLSLGERAFQSCSKLEEIHLAVLPEIIPTYAFYGCTSAKIWDSPAGYTVIEQDAFTNFGQAPMKKVKTGLYYLDEQGALYWICDDLAYYVGCPNTVAEYEVLTETPKIGDYGPYLIDSSADVFINYGAIGDLNWYIVKNANHNTLVITGNGPIPNYSANGYPWYASRNNIHDVVIEDGVTAVGNNAFTNCVNMTQASIGAGVESIGTTAFKGCAKLAKVYLPDGLTSIGESAFYKCGIKELVIPGSVQTMGKNAFESCAALQTLEIQDGVPAISNAAFQNCSGLVEVKLPESLTSIGEKTFANCTSLESITIPGSVQTMGMNAFENCTALQTLEIQDGVPAISNAAFQNCSGLVEVKLPESLTSIGENAFANCKALESITIPGSVQTIGNSAFSDCGALKDVVLGDGVSQIGQGAFENCVSLSRVVIPATVATINSDTFLNCSSLSEVVLRQGYTTIDGTAFAGTPCNYLMGTIYTDENGVQYKIIQSKAFVVFQPKDVSDDMIPEYIDTTGNNYPVVKDAYIIDEGTCNTGLTWKLLQVGEQKILVISGTGAINYSNTSEYPWYQYRSEIDVVVVEEGVTSISGNAFSSYPGIKEATIPGTVTSLSSCFYNCKDLTKATIGEGTNMIGGYAFANCSSLAEVVFPDTVTSIQYNAFGGCSSLKEVELPEALKSIVGSAFYNCTGLERIDIPDGVTSIGDSAFYGCSSLEEVELPEALTSIANSVFCNCTSLEAIDIPAGVTSIGAYAFKGCSSLAEVKLPAALQTIGNDAFLNCTSVETIDIPDGVTSIGTGAFSGCTSLTEMVLPENLASIGENTFFYNTNLRTLHLKSAEMATVHDSAFGNTAGVNSVIVEPGVDILYSALFESLHKSNNTVSVEFVGSNHFTISEGFDEDTWNALEGDLLNRMAPGESYYMDAQGVLYRIADGSAMLIYVPAGIAEFTVPAVIPAEDEGEATIPVVGVGSDALNEASDLKSLTFQSPDTITTLEDRALANCPTLRTVNDQRTVNAAQALFNEGVLGEDVFLSTGLMTDYEEWILSRPTSGKAEDNVYVMGNVFELTVNTDPDTNTSTDGTLAFYTGQVADSHISYTRKSESGADEKVRVYFYFTSPDGVFPFELGTKGFDITNDEGEKVGVLDVTIDKKPDSNTYWIEFPALKMGQTVKPPINYMYDVPKAGGDLYIWAEVLDDEGVTTHISENTQKLTWETVPYDFSLAKVVSSAPRFIGNGTEDGVFTVYGLQYDIKLTPITKNRIVEDQDKALDPIAGAEFADVLDFPEVEEGNGQKLHWIDGVVDAVRNGDWIVRKGTITTGWEVAVLINGEYKPLYAVKNNNITDLKVWLTEEEDIAVGWYYRNTDLNNAKPTWTFTLRVADGMIEGESIKDLTSAKEYGLDNHVTADQFFCYSDPQYDEADRSVLVSTNSAKLEASKTVDKKYDAIFGEAYPYTITLKNTGTQHLHQIQQIVDELPDDLYITPQDMFTMLTEDMGGEYLTITIDEATIYNQLPDWGTVTGTDGKEYALNIQNTSIKTVYHGMEKTEEEGCIAQYEATLVIGKADNGVWVSLNGEEQRVAVSGEHLQEVLYDLGYFVTPTAGYKLEWNFPEGTSLWSAETRQYKIRSTVKDAFMAISWDHTMTPTWEEAKPNQVTKSMTKNSATVKYVLWEGDDISQTQLTVDKDTKLTRDFLVKTEFYKDGHTAAVGSSGIVEGGGLVTLCMSVDHKGTASYDMVPLVSQMHGTQILLARVVDNPHLADPKYGLTVRTIAGIDYFLLDHGLENNEAYPNVVLDGYLADRVLVEVNPNNSNDLTTTIHWYLTEINGPKNLHIDCKVLMATNGAPTTSSIFEVDNEVWLNDHQTHRLWYAMGSKWSFASFDKEIVTGHTPGMTLNDVVDEDGFLVIHEGDSVTYRLKVTGMLSPTSIQAGKTVVVPGTVLFDKLPLNMNDWATPIVEYVYNPEEVTIQGEDRWSVTKVNPRTGAVVEDQQYIVWSDQFEMTYHQTSTVYIYITLQYPEGAAWGEYCRNYGSIKLANTMYFANDTESVRHDVDLKAAAKLVKGVNSTGVWQNNTYYPSTNSNSRFNYTNEDNLNRIVTYYITVYNDGNTRLYLNDIQDHLPTGFTYRENSVVVSDDIAVVKDASNQTVVYKTATITCTVEENGNLRFHIDKGGNLEFDSEYGFCYLKPQEALTFSYQCFVGNADETQINSVNTAAMPHFDYNFSGVEVGSSLITGTSAYQTIKNDGGCTLQNNLNAEYLYGFETDQGEDTQWLQSQVRVQKGDIVPGIEKRVVGVKSNIGDTTGNSTSQATFYDYVEWEVRASNSGTTPIRDYVLTDVMQKTYDFVKDVKYTIYYGDYYDGKLSVTDTLFNMDSLRDDSNLNPETGIYEMTLMHKTFGEMVITYAPYGDDTNAVLEIRFKDPKAAIPEGGESSLLIVTKNSKAFATTTYVNTSYITPSETWDENAVKRGEQVVYNDQPAVMAAAQIAVSSAYQTTSVKAVEEKGNAANTTNSEAPNNAIVLGDGRNAFTYTLKIQNVGQPKDVMQQLVIIDSLPGENDHSVLMDTDLRYSEFPVYLASEPNFAVIVGNRTLTEDEFSIQFSSKTSFDKADWNGQGSNWTDEPTGDTRSFRIVMSATRNEDGTYAGTPIRNKEMVTVRFDASIREADLKKVAMPGEVAWNSFGYYYTLFDDAVPLAAAPAKVGVKLPSVPQLVKCLETPEGEHWITDKDETFSYVIYRQDATAEMPVLDGLSEEEIGQALQNAGVAFTRVSLTVPANSSESDTVMLNNLNEWICIDGYWAESENEWVWENGVAYVFYELPIVNQKQYAFGAISGIYENGFGYVHNSAERATIVGMNFRKVWNINLLKVSDSKQIVPLKDAWFGLYGLRKPEEEVVLPEALADKITAKEFEERMTVEYTLNGETKTYYLQSVAVSNSEGLILWEKLKEDVYLIQEFAAPDGFHYDDAIHVAERPDDVIFNVCNLRVVNRSGYEMPKSGGIGTHWNTMAGVLLMVASTSILLAVKRRRKGASA